jgi:hypothetical protein
MSESFRARNLGARPFRGSRCTCCSGERWAGRPATERPGDDHLGQEGRVGRCCPPERCRLDRSRLRVARAFNGKVVSEVTEGDLTADVVIVLKAVGVGKTSIVYALTKDESATAKQAKTFVVTVSG